MNPLIQFKQTILPLLIVSVLGCFGLSATVRALDVEDPPPNGGLPGNNTLEGDFALHFLTTGRNNTAFGNSALEITDAGNDNTGTGAFALAGTPDDNGDRNTATGSQALEFDLASTDNTATGYKALKVTETGFNTATGAFALNGNGFSGGFNNTATGWNALNHSGGNNNTATGSQAMAGLVTGENNTATGEEALHQNTSGGFNTANGWEALISNLSGFNNVAIGFQALDFITSGFNNTAIGSQALVKAGGHENTAIGYQALFNSAFDDTNTALGFKAGVNHLSGSNNIDIGNHGVAVESNTTRIGDVQTKMVVSGVFGATASGGVAVFVNSSGQLGTLTSSARFKDEIKPMDNVSEAILGLKPVTFRYKKEIDPEGIPQFGLVAEQVAKVNPDLVVGDAKGQVYTVRYEAVNAMLLNEFLKEHPKVQEIGAAVSQLEKEMDTLTAEVREHAAQIQKVSTQLELSKPAPQTVLNQ